MSPIVHPKLEVSEDLRFQHRWWRVERIGWTVMALVLLASLAGALGDGPLSRAATRSASGTFEISFDRVGRRMSPQNLALHIQLGNKPQTVTLSISRSFLAHVELREIFPEPVTVSADASRRLYEFSPAPGAAQIWITVEFEPNEAGLLRGTFTVGDESVAISQLVLP